MTMPQEGVARGLVERLRDMLDPEGGPKCVALAADEIERLREALRKIAEGNLGDMPWQANYARIKEAATAALSSDQRAG